MNFYLVHSVARDRAVQAVKDAPEGHEVIVREPRRNLDQSARFHAICGDISRSSLEWGGKKRRADQWKVLLISGHAMATKEDVEIVRGLEGELINIRESTALMSKKRAASLIEYATAFAISNGVKLRG